jgi:hypothetical protein
MASLFYPVHNSTQYCHMGGVMLDNVDQEKDLGVVISSDLKVSKQCVQAYGKANKIMGMIIRTIQFKSIEIMLNLYKALVRPLLVVFRTGYWINRGLDQPGRRPPGAEEALASISPRVRVWATVRTVSGPGPWVAPARRGGPGYHFSIYLGVYL